MKLFLYFFLFLLIFAKDNQLFFKNGDIITGKVIQLEKNVVIFKYQQKKLPIDFIDLKSIKIKLKLLKELRKNKENIFSTNEKKHITPQRHSKLYFPSLNKREIKKRKYHNSTKFTLGFNNSTGNKENLGGYFKLKGKRKNYYNIFTLDASSSYTESENNVTVDQSNLNFEFSSRIKNNLFTDFDIRFFRNSINNLNLRTNLALGISYKQVKGFKIGTSISYIDEDFQIDTDSDQYFASELTVNYSTELSSKTKLSFKNRFTFSSKNSQDILYNGTVNLDFPFNSKTSTKFTIETNWDNTPSTGNRSTQVLYHLSISFNL